MMSERAKSGKHGPDEGRRQAEFQGRDGDGPQQPRESRSQRAQRAGRTALPEEHREYRELERKEAREPLGRMATREATRER
jgi:hypothetical protein